MSMIKTGSLAFCFLLLATAASIAGGISVVGSLSREITLEPGSKNEGKIVLQNNTDKSREVKVYQTDYLFFADGKNIYGEPGSIARSNSSWITFTPRQFVIPAKDTYTIYYTVQAPQDPDLVGTYWSVMMVEELSASAPDPLAPKEATAQVGVRTVVRYGIQFVTSIGDTGKRSLKFEAQALVTKVAERTLQLDVKNVAERYLRPTVWVELYDDKGVSAGRFEGGRLRLLPGCSGRFNIDLSKVPTGEYQAIAVADNGDDYVFGAQYKLDIK